VTRLVTSCDPGLRSLRSRGQAKKLGYQGTIKDCVIELKAMKKVLEIDLDKAKEYLKVFADADAGKRGEITYDQVRNACDTAGLLVSRSSDSRGGEAAFMLESETCAVVVLK
jgi:hypothetical protein